MNDMHDMTPTVIVEKLDEYIIGQDQAKRAVAIAVRNRWRRQQLAAEIRDEVAPKNIIMSGPTGVGKTEIARRLAGLVGAPFSKVEATKFTEVGYVGRDVESMIRDLLERGIQIVRERKIEECKDIAELATENRLLDYLLPMATPTADDSAAQERYHRTRGKLREQLRGGSLEEREIEISVEEKSMSVNIFSNMGMDHMEPEMQNMFDKLMPNKTSRRRVTVKEGRHILRQQELDKLIDQNKLIEEAITLTEQTGIVFVDEIDKICGGESMGPDVSREGVQRDLLPMVEGCSVNTRHGQLKTDHILFIAAGAFSRNKPSDLMPELQGRFPIRVKLQDLDQEQFKRILTEPQNALTKQQVALMQTEGIELVFTDEGIEALAQKAYELNESQQNIGARRLYAVMEKVLEQVSYDAPDHAEASYTIDGAFVETHLKEAMSDDDLSLFGFAKATQKK